MLNKVISGGQTGIDQAALIIANLNKISTGGFAPYNWMTEMGPQEKLLSEFGLIADKYDPKIYPLRTLSNIKGSDGTLVFTCGISSVGTKLTINLCKKNNKPILIIEEVDSTSLYELYRFIKSNNIKTLNVAGPRLSKMQHKLEEHLYFINKAFIEINKLYETD